MKGLLNLFSSPLPPPPPSSLPSLLPVQTGIVKIIKLFITFLKYIVQNLNDEEELYILRIFDKVQSLHMNINKW